MRADARHLLLATVPAALAGLWSLGSRIAAGTYDPAEYWQLGLLGGFGVNFESPGVFATLAAGIAFWLPLFAIALLTSYCWAHVFARARARAPDPGWLPHAWVFSLLLPATMPLGHVALALSFGLLFACHAFGGTGRYLVHPSLLAFVFVAFAYPALVDTTAWLPGNLQESTWSLAASAAAGGAQAPAMSLFDAFVGRDVGAIGTTPSGLCLLGALYLIAARRASAAIVTGGMLAVIAGGSVIGHLSGLWQLALGNFAFALAFIATDRTTQPQSLAGQWVFGAVFGLLTVVLRTADPAHPESTWAALLLACLIVPLIDRLTIRPGRAPVPAVSEANGGPR